MTTLTEQQQERVARALAQEYAYLGISLAAARVQVATSGWDDHPKRGN